VTAGLDASGVKWTRNSRLVRGLDYYRHTAFEFVTDRLGAQGTVLAGGRYDGLIGDLGGLETPGVGWAAGVERLGMLLAEPAGDALAVAIVAEQDEARASCISLAGALRRSGYRTEVVASGSVRKRYDKALKLGPREIV